MERSSATRSSAKTSAGVPSSTTRPSRITTTRANVSATNRMSWLMATTVRPSAAQASMIERTRSTPRASWPVVGSSSTSTGVRMARTEASARSFRREWPRSYGFVRSSSREACRIERGIDRGREVPAGSAEVPRSELDLGPYRAGEDLAVRVLEDQADQGGQPRGGERCRIAAVDQHAPLGRAQQAVEVAHERGLAAAVLADERQPIAGRDRERHAVEGADRPLAVDVHEVLDAKLSHARSPAGPGRGRRPAGPGAGGRRRAGRRRESEAVRRRARRRWGRRGRCVPR